MNHPLEGLLALAAGNDLPPWSAWRVRRHLSTCADCRKIIAEYAQLRVEISALPVPEPSAKLVPMILASVTREEGTPVNTIGWLGWSAAAAVAALAVVAVLPRIAVENFAPHYTALAPQAPNVVKTAPVVLPVAEPAIVNASAPKFTNVTAAEEDRDSRYLQALAKRPSQELDRWTADNRSLPQVVVGPRAEMLRSHALPGKVEVVALAGSPVEIVRAEAYFAEGRLIDPAVEIRNATSRPIANYELIWTVRDASGNEYRGKIANGKALAPGQHTKLSETIVLAPAHKGAETAIAAARVFVRSVATADSVWVPERTALAANHLDSLVPLTAKTVQLLGEYHRQSAQAHAQLK